jgi:hypothetical protein
MNEADQSQFEHRGFAWAGVVLALASLGYSIRFMIQYPRPELPFFFRYQLASMGILMVSFATARLFSRGSQTRRSLEVVAWAGFLAAIIGTFQTPR